VIRSSDQWESREG